MRRAMLAAGVADGDVLVFSELMDCRSLFLTANADTVYFLTFLDLGEGPVVVDVPPDRLTVADDMWFRWVTDLARPGRTGARAAATSSPGPGTRARCPRAGCSCTGCGRTGVAPRALLPGGRQPAGGPPDPGAAEDHPVHARRLRDVGRFLPARPPSPSRPNRARRASWRAAAWRSTPSHRWTPRSSPPRRGGAGRTGHRARPGAAAPIAAIGIVKDEPFAPDGTGRRCWRTPRRPRTRTSVPWRCGRAPPRA
ncbi:DUF1254 domain-containing protein, partial [Kitasatospora aburaviensis]